MKKDPLLAASYIFTLVFLFFYLTGEMFALPTWWYLPLERQWIYSTVPPAGLAMGWYGKLLLCMSLAGVAGVAGYGVLKWLKRIPAPFYGAMDLAVMGLTLFLLYFMAVTLAWREITPPPPVSALPFNPAAYLHKEA